MPDCRCGVKSNCVLLVCGGRQDGVEIVLVWTTARAVEDTLDGAALCSIGDSWSPETARSPHLLIANASSIKSRLVLVDSNTGWRRTSHTVGGLRSAGLRRPSGQDRDHADRRAPRDTDMVRTEANIRVEDSPAPYVIHAMFDDEGDRRRPSFAGFCATATDRAIAERIIHSVRFLPRTAVMAATAAATWRACQKRIVAAEGRKSIAGSGRPSSSRIEARDETASLDMADSSVRTGACRR